jgi:hypothetical protein
MAQGPMNVVPVMAGAPDGPGEVFFIPTDQNERVAAKRPRRDSIGDGSPEDFVWDPNQVRIQVDSVTRSLKSTVGAFRKAKDDEPAPKKYKLREKSQNDVDFEAGLLCADNAAAGGPEHLCFCMIPSDRSLFKTRTETIKTVAAAGRSVESDPGVLGLVAYAKGAELSAAVMRGFTVAPKIIPVRTDDSDDTEPFFQVFCPDPDSKHCWIVKKSAVARFCGIVSEFSNRNGKSLALSKFTEVPFDWMLFVEVVRSIGTYGVATFCPGKPWLRSDWSVQPPLDTRGILFKSTEPMRSVRPKV